MEIEVAFTDPQNFPILLGIFAIILLASRRRSPVPFSVPLPAAMVIPPSGRGRFPSVVRTSLLLAAALLVALAAAGPYIPYTLKLTASSPTVYLVVEDPSYAQMFSFPGGSGVNVVVVSWDGSILTVNSRDPALLKDPMARFDSGDALVAYVMTGRRGRPPFVAANSPKVLVCLNETLIDLSRAMTGAELVVKPNTTLLMDLASHLESGTMVLSSSGRYSLIPWLALVAAILLYLEFLVLRIFYPFDSFRLAMIVPLIVPLSVENLILLLAISVPLSYALTRREPGEAISFIALDIVRRSGEVRVRDMALIRTAFRFTELVLLWAALALGIHWLMAASSLALSAEELICRGIMRLP